MSLHRLEWLVASKCVVIRVLEVVGSETRIDQFSHISKTYIFSSNLIY